MRLWHRYFPVNFAKFLKTPFIIEHLWWLLLNLSWYILPLWVFFESFKVFSSSKMHEKSKIRLCSLRGVEKNGCFGKPHKKKTTMKKPSLRKATGLHLYKKKVFLQVISGISHFHIVNFEHVIASWEKRFTTLSTIYHKAFCTNSFCVVERIVTE